LRVIQLLHHPPACTDELWSTRTGGVLCPRFPGQIAAAAAADPRLELEPLWLGGMVWATGELLVLLLLLGSAALAHHRQSRRQAETVGDLSQASQPASHRPAS
jgi:hypothetical protein